MKSVQYTITYYDDKNNNTLSESKNILQAP